MDYERSFSMTTINRLSFLRAAGVATGTAAIAASPALAAAVEPGPVEAIPGTPIPNEPIVAVIRDPARGEITVLSGTTERTYTDRLLVNRLLKAAGRNNSSQRRQGVA
jgi:hypothetical protein